MEQRVNKLENELAETKSDVVDIKTRLAVAENNIRDMKEDITSIKNNTTWILRLIVGAIVLAVLGFLFQGGAS